jgi:hypothetical protein
MDNGGSNRELNGEGRRKAYYCAYDNLVGKGGGSWDAVAMRLQVVF